MVISASQLLKNSTVEDTAVNHHLPQNQSNDASLNTCVFLEKNILLVISKMKIAKAPDPDEISPRILKERKTKYLNCFPSYLMNH